MDIPDDLRDLEKLREFLKAFPRSERKKFADEAIKRNRGLSDNYPQIDDIHKFKRWAVSRNRSREGTRFIKLSGSGKPLEENVRHIIYCYACEYGYLTVGAKQKKRRIPLFVSADDEANEIVENYAKNHLISKNKAVVELIKIAATFHE